MDHRVDWQRLSRASAFPAFPGALRRIGFDEPGSRTSVSTPGMGKVASRKRDLVTGFTGLNHAGRRIDPLP